MSKPSATNFQDLEKKLNKVWIANNPEPRTPSISIESPTEQPPFPITMPNTPIPETPTINFLELKKKLNNFYHSNKFSVPGQPPSPLTNPYEGNEYYNLSEIHTSSSSSSTSDNEDSSEECGMISNPVDSRTGYLDTINNDNQEAMRNAPLPVKSKTLKSLISVMDMQRKLAIQNITPGESNSANSQPTSKPPPPRPKPNGRNSDSKPLPPNTRVPTIPVTGKHPNTLNDLKSDSKPLPPNTWAPPIPFSRKQPVVLNDLKQQPPSPPPPKPNSINVDSKPIRDLKPDSTPLSPNSWVPVIPFSGKHPLVLNDLKPQPPLLPKPNGSNADSKPLRDSTPLSPKTWVPVIPFSGKQPVVLNDLNQQPLPLSPKTNGSNADSKSVPPNLWGPPLPINGKHPSSLNDSKPLPPKPNGMNAVSKSVPPHLRGPPNPVTGKQPVRRPLPTPSILDEQPYYYEVKRTEAEQLVLGLMQDGAFLVRPTERGGADNPYALTIVHFGKAIHLNIRNIKGNYALGKEKPGEKVFNSIPDMIYYHRNVPIYVASQEFPGREFYLKAHPNKKFN